MKTRKPALAAVSLFAALSVLAPGGAVADSVADAIDESVFDQTVFASSYITLSADSEVNGSVWSGEATTVGADSVVDGSVVSLAATTLGASVCVDGNVISGAATTLGAGAIVDGEVFSGAATTLGAGAKENLDFYVRLEGSATPVTQDLMDAQIALWALDSVDILPGEISTETTYGPGNYRVAGSLSVSADTTIVLDAQGENGDFIFNISDYLSFGARVDVVLLNPATSPATNRVIWNVTGTHITTGEQSNVVGLLLSNGYVSTGAKSTVKGVGSSAGGVYSATSYITLGAGAAIGSLSQDVHCNDD